MTPLSPFRSSYARLSTMRGRKSTQASRIINSTIQMGTNCTGQGRRSKPKCSRVKITALSRERSPFISSDSCSWTSYMSWSPTSEPSPHNRGKGTPVNFSPMKLQVSRRNGSTTTTSTRSRKGWKETKLCLRKD